MSKIKQFASNFKHKPGESTSSRPGWMVRDSHLTIGGLLMTNITAGTFTELKHSKSLSGSCRLCTLPTSLNARRGPLQSRHPLMFIVSLTLLVLPFFFSNLDTHATQSNIGITISGSPSVDIKSTPGGTFADSGNSTITITTNHASGYTLTAKASNSTSLEGVNGGSIPSIASAVSPTNYADNTYATSHNLNDTWAYKPEKYNSTSNTDYRPSPGLGTASSPLDTLDTTTNSSSSPYTYTVSIGARVSTATAIDSYSNSFVFAVVGNPTPYAITYNKNTTDTVSNMPANHTTSDTGAAGETVTLASNTPTRTGYSFNGWCTVVPTTSGGIDSCSGTGATTYAAGDDWTIDQTTNTNSLNLYAMWNRNSYNVKVNFAGSGVSSVSFTASGYTTRTVSASGGTASLMYGVQYTTTMNFSSGNEFSSWALNSSSYGTLSSTSTNPTYFTPNTNSNSAIITATGKVSCAHTTFSGYMQTISSSTVTNACDGDTGTMTDRRNSNTYTVAKINGNLWMTQNLRITGTITATDSNFSSPSSFNTAAGGDLRGGSATYTAAQSHLADSTDVSSAPSGYTTTMLGAWYNYCAASAGQVCSQTKMDATQDICPAGWKLPTNSQQNGITSYASAYNPIYGGFYASGSLDSATSYGYWWSSKAYTAYNQYSLYYYIGRLNTNLNGKARGSYIRCILNSS